MRERKITGPREGRFALGVVSSMGSSPSFTSRKLRADKVPRVSFRDDACSIPRKAVFKIVVRRSDETASGILAQCT